MRRFVLCGAVIGFLIGFIGKANLWPPLKNFAVFDMCILTIGPPSVLRVSIFVGLVSSLVYAGMSVLLFVLLKALNWTAKRA